MFQRLRMGTLDKVAMRFEAPFWPTDREFFARIYPTDSENPANNTASRTLSVADGDLDGPAIG